MNRRILVGCLLAPFSLFCALPAAAEPYFCVANGHYYEVIAQAGIDWDAAEEAALDRTFAGGAGHLATITSPEEDLCVQTAWQEQKPSRTEVWIGGSQPPISGGRGHDWTWVNGEGAISTPQVPTGGYSNWASGEPNDNYGTNSEQHLAVGLGNNYKWNDEGGPGVVNNIGGYIVEYETATTLSGADCNPSCVYNGLEYTVDIEDEETITFQSFLRPDNDARCGNETRDFTFQTVAGPIQTTMAKYLCGVKNPDTEQREFVAVVVSKSFDSLEAADIQTDPSEYFEFSLACNNPIPGLTDLRNQDIAHFATDIVNDMPRKHSSDATYDCGSSRGKVKGTVLFIGTQYVFKDAAGNELPLIGNPEAVEQEFIGITRDRVEDLIKAIDEAKPGVPRKKLLHWLSMRVAAGLALWSHDKGYYSVARAKVNLVNHILPKTSFNANAGSAPAFIDIWGSHLVFMYDVKVIPYAP